MESLDEGLVTEGVVGVEPLVEVVRAVEDLGQEEVEEGPELVEVVLERSPGEQQPVGGLDLPDDHAQLALLILDSVRLVNHHVLPVELLKHALLPDNKKIKFIKILVRVPKNI